MFLVGPLIIMVLLLAVGLAAVGTVLIIRSTRYVEESPRCLKCDYDLRYRERGSTHCPECGEPGSSATKGVTTSRRRLLLGLLALAGVPVAFALLAVIAYVFL